jgi:MFS family permease
VAPFALAGFFGVVALSRDTMVRGDASGRAAVFGFVTTGFNVGGIAAPLLFGAILDYGDPGLVFWTAAGLSLLTLLVVYATARSGQQHHTAPAHR